MEIRSTYHQNQGSIILKSIFNGKTMEDHKGAPPKGTFQSIMLTIIAGLILSGVLKLFSMSEQIVRLDERDRQKVEKIDAIQTGQNKIQMDQNKIQLDLFEIKDRLYRLETKDSMKK